MTSRPSFDDVDLARRASRYLGTDKVLPTQAAVYRELLRSGQTGDPMRDFLPGMSRDQAVQIAGSDLRAVELPSLVRRAIESRYCELKRSHRWKKGIVATALALTEHQRDQMG